MTPRLDRATITELLRAWAVANVSAAATVPDAWPMPGNAGLSFGFDVVIDDQRAAPGFDALSANGRIALVVRLAPPGVRRSGNTDVLRQVPLLDALRTSGVPVAAVMWSSPDESWFGTDAVVQERLDALPLHMTEPSLSVVTDDRDVSRFVREAVSALASIHAVDWQKLLPGWEVPRSATDELSHWQALLRRCEEPSWVHAGDHLVQALKRSQPATLQTGLLHGDFQTNNVLYGEDGGLRAVVDWELAGIGPQLLDLGWLAMFCDIDSWAEPYAGQMRVRVPPVELRGLYEEATGRPTEGFAWHQAFACYRFAAIAAFNIRLHRTGKRPDPAWEDKVSSVPRLFARGLELIAPERRSPE